MSGKTSTSQQYFMVLGPSVDGPAIIVVCCANCGCKGNVDIRPHVHR